MRAISAVDPVNLMMLLIRKEAQRYKKACNAVSHWTTSLTPKGEEIWQKAFEVNICNMYVYVVRDRGGYHEIMVTKKATKADGGCMHTVKMPKNAVKDSMFGSCTYGVPQTKTIPCEHMVAIVQSGNIPTLTELLKMPTWCLMHVRW